MMKLSLTAAALSLSFVSLAQAQTVEIATPTPGSSFDYLWQDGALDRVTVLSTTGNRLRVRVDADFENDGTVDDTTIHLYDLRSRLWLALMGTDYVMIFTPAAGVEMPVKLSSGLDFNGTFDLMETDGLANFSPSFSQSHTTCVYNLLDEPVELAAGSFKALELDCSDAPVLDDGMISTAPEDQNPYTETWSVELGMPIFQTFGLNPENNKPDSWATLVDYRLN